MNLADFDYELPPELIAQSPIKNRTSSKLMVLNRKERKIFHHNSFAEITNYLQKGDLLVVNNTKVIPAKLVGERPTGARVEILVIKVKAPRLAEGFINVRKGARPGEVYNIGAFQVTAKEKLEGSWLIDFGNSTVEEVMNDVGFSPLPPYIKRKENLEEQEKFDKHRYQTVYAEHPGAIAAPTAGLHFSDELLQDVKNKGIEVASIVLHVGLGTFLPVRCDNILEHKMHSEEFIISEEAASSINKALEENRRIICVGTTSCRAVESAVINNLVVAQQRSTDIFIYPGYKFQVMKALVTNFHLPKSTLLMLISAFADKDFILEAYEEAVKHKYRFFSYGDAMLIL